MFQHILLLAGEGDIPYPWNLLTNYGILGAVVVLWLTGFLVSKRELDRETKRADKNETDKDSLNLRVTTEIVPLLTEATQILASFKPSPNKDLIDMVSALTAKVEELNKR